MRLGPRLGSGLALGSASRLSAWIWLDFGLDFGFGWISARFWFDLILAVFLFDFDLILAGFGLDSDLIVI